MVGSQTGHRGTSHNRQPSKNRDLQVCWANTSKGMPSHTTILHTAATEKIDVVCIQEPWTLPGSKTQNHPAYTVSTCLLSLGLKPLPLQLRMSIVKCGKVSSGVDNRFTELERKMHALYVRSVHGYVLA